jgi:hypothetical protein
MTDFDFHPAAGFLTSGPLLSRTRERTPRGPREFALRLHGKSARSGGAGLAAQGRLEIRHHDDIVLSRPLDDQARAQFGHALVAGPAFYRVVAASGERDRLLRDFLRSRRRAWRAGDGLICARAASGDHAKLKKNSRHQRRHRVRQQI